MRPVVLLKRRCLIEWRDRIQVWLVRLAAECDHVVNALPVRDHAATVVVRACFVRIEGH